MSPCRVALILTDGKPAGVGQRIRRVASEEESAGKSYNRYIYCGDLSNLPGQPICTIARPFVLLKSVESRCGAVV